ncbi:MAG: leucine-rich repeat domain-containing protein, partial [Clostridia bacterium]|nr:leucine-rich repeat domain-containing protein [Clostridia bacterium]
MQKRTVKALSVFLTLLMLLSSLPLGGLPAVFAEEKRPLDREATESTDAAGPIRSVGDVGSSDGTTRSRKVRTSDQGKTYQNTELVYGSGGTITRAEWLHDLSVLFEMSVTDETMPEKYFSDLSESDPWYIDVMLGVEFGVVDIPAGGEVRPQDPATRAFAAQTLNFCLGFQLEDKTFSFSDAAAMTDPAAAQIAVNRGWFSLVAGAFVPEQPITVAELRAMIADTQKILSDTVITPGKTTVSFADFVRQIPYGTSVDMNADGDVIITGYRGTISVGEVFSVFFGDLPAVYIAESVSVNNDITIVAVREYDGEESPVLALEMSGEALLDPERFEPAEGFDAQIVTETIEKEDQTENASEMTPQKTGNSKVKKAQSGGRQPRKTENIKAITGSLKKSLGKGVTLSGSAKLYDLKLDYSASLIDLYAKAELSGKADINASIKLSTKGISAFPSTINLGKVGIPGIASVSLDLNLTVSAQLTYCFTGRFSVGAEFRNGSFRFIRSFVKESWSTTVELDGELELKASADINALGVLKGNIYARVGLHSNYKRTDYNSGKPATCETFSMWLFADIGASISINFKVFKKDYSEKFVFYDKNNSPISPCVHREDGQVVDHCTRGSGDVTVTGGTSSPYSRYGWIMDGNSGTYQGKPFTRFEYELDENGDAIITNYNGNVSAVLIPDTLDGHTVVGIGSSAFKGKYLRSVTIPDTVKTIDRKAFYNCKNLSSVSLPAKLETMNGDAFGECTSLTSINIPKTLKDVSTTGYDLEGQYFGPFHNCSGLKKVTFESGITEIPFGLFGFCSGIEEISIPNTVTLIRSRAFMSCTALKTVNLSDSLT